MNADRYRQIAASLVTPSPAVSRAAAGLWSSKSCILILLAAAVASAAAADVPRPARQISNGGSQSEVRTVAGWTLHISPSLLATNTASATGRAVDLVKAQLDEIVRVVPPAAVAELQKVPLWFSPEYPGIPPRAEYHPNPGWLREHGRNPEMGKGVEFTNIRIFEAETRRMPNFALHELAHSYQDRVLSQSGAEAEIKAAYEQAKAGGAYDRVERQDAEGRKRMDRAYALVNPQEYFAETTEAFFARNDFFPYTKEQLKQTDPVGYALMEKTWGVSGGDPAAVLQPARGALP